MTTAKELRDYSKWAGRPPVLEIAADMLVLQAEEIAAYAELRSQDIKQFADLAGKYAAQQKRIAQLEAANLNTDRLLSRVLHELAGAASLCWEPNPSGVFDSQTAIDFVEAAINELRAALNPTGEQP